MTSAARAPAPLGVSELNELDRREFAARLEFVFERSPWIPAEAWAERPFADLDALHRAMCRAVERAPRARQLELIRAHPDLAGKAAAAGGLTAESRSEQSSAGLDRLTAAELERFTALNRAYRERFGFPFVICVRDTDKQGVLRSFAERLEHSPDEEVRAALREIERIAYLRLRDAAGPPA